MAFIYLNTDDVAWKTEMVRRIGRYLFSLHTSFPSIFVLSILERWFLPWAFSMAKLLLLFLHVSWQTIL